VVPIDVQKQLDQAVQRLCAESDAGGILTEYMVITVQRGFGGDGDSTTELAYFTGPNRDGIPHHHVIGMLEFAQMAVREDMAGQGGY